MRNQRPWPSHVFTSFARSSINTFVSEALDLEGNKQKALTGEKKCPPPHADNATTVRLEILETVFLPWSSLTIPHPSVTRLHRGAVAHFGIRLRCLNCMAKGQTDVAVGNSTRLWPASPLHEVLESLAATRRLLVLVIPV